MCSGSTKQNHLSDNSEKNSEWKGSIPKHSTLWPEVPFYFENTNNIVLASALLWMAKTSFVFALLCGPLNAQDEKNHLSSPWCAERCWAVKRLLLDMIRLPPRKGFFFLLRYWTLLQGNWITEDSCSPSGVNKCSKIPQYYTMSQETAFCCRHNIIYSRRGILHCGATE